MEKRYEIGNFIADLRREKNLTQSRLAEELGVSNKAVSKWENGQALPATKIMPRLCEILGVTLEELLDGKRKLVSDSPMLDDLQRLDHVYKYYSDDNRVNVGVSDINLTFNLGEKVAITGPSGSGKTTLLRMIGGIDRFERGEIFIHREGISRFDEEDYERYRKDFIAYVFQEYGVLEHYSLLDNLLIIRLLMGDTHAEAKKKAGEMLGKIGLSRFAGKKASKLSGGQKQKLAVGRALLKDAPIILGDEITSSLDRKGAREVLRLLFSHSEGKLVILATHHYEEMEEYCTRRIWMKDGTVERDEVLSIVPHVEPKPSAERNGKPNPMRAAGILWRNRLGLTLPLLFLFLIPASAIVGGNVGMDIAYQATSTQASTPLFQENEIYVRKAAGFAEEELKSIVHAEEGTLIAEPHWGAVTSSYVADPAVPSGILYTRAGEEFGLSYPTPVSVRFAEIRALGEDDPYLQRIAIDDYLTLAPVFSYLSDGGHSVSLRYAEQGISKAIGFSGFQLYPADNGNRIKVRRDVLPAEVDSCVLDFGDGSSLDIGIERVGEAEITFGRLGIPSTLFGRLKANVTEIHLLCPGDKKTKMKTDLKAKGYVVLSREDELNGWKDNASRFSNEAVFAALSLLIAIVLIPLSRRFSGLLYQAQKDEMALWRRIGFSRREVLLSYLSLHLFPMLLLELGYFVAAWFIGFHSPVLLILSLIESGALSYFLVQGDVKALRKAMEEKR